jgi:hypothetical protein
LKKGQRVNIKVTQNEGGTKQGSDK